MFAVPEPEPLVPPDYDVSSLSDFRLDVDRLLVSELVAIGTPEECWAALMLWCRAWKQVPGGSLPNDDRILAAFSGAGKRWPKVRDVALHGFVLCSDGRLYHRFLCEEVKRAYKSRMASETRRDADRKRLQEWREKRSRNGSETRFVAEVPVPEPEPVPEPQISKNSEAIASETRARRSGDGRKTRIAADWQPDSQDRGYAEARGWPWDRIDEQAAAFRDRCTRDEPRYADWHAAWRTWVRNADKFGARDARAFNGSGSRQSRSGSIAEAARNVLSRLDLD